MIITGCSKLGHPVILYIFENLFIEHISQIKLHLFERWNCHGRSDNKQCQSHSDSQIQPKRALEE